MSLLIEQATVGLGVALSLTTAVWLISLLRRDAGIIDRFWGLGFVLLTAVYLARGEGMAVRPVLGCVMVGLWGVRLSWHIHRRNRGKPEDYRYREMRDKHGARFPWVSLVTVFGLQGLLMALISAPLMQVATIAGPRRITVPDVLAVGLFVVGFLFESIGDRQLTRFRADPVNHGRVLQSGLWRYTRHPNYFGDAVVWWSFFVLALSTPGAWWTLYAPGLMTLLLMRVSGVTLLERKLVRSRPAYQDYIRRTNAFFPWFPRD